MPDAWMALIGLSLLLVTVAWSGNGIARARFDGMVCHVIERSMT